MAGNFWRSMRASFLFVTTGCVINMADAPELGSVEQALSAANASDRAELALHWAPIHYQDVDQTGDHAHGGRSDYITRVDFDGDFDARNDWENTTRASASFRAHAYFSVAETTSHWFVTYLFFHPRDWSDAGFDNEHENDAEGLLAIVERDGSPYGQLRAIITVAHSDFYAYVPNGSPFTSGREDIDGTLTMTSHLGSLHPVTAQEAKGHGLKARPYYDIKGGDGLVYYPHASTAEIPSGPNDREVFYTLIELTGPSSLWERRNDGALFASFGSFAGDAGGGCGAGTRSCSNHAANAPWRWDDKDDLPGRGELALDPAKVAAEYFTIPGSFARSYRYQPYR